MEYAVAYGKGKYKDGFENVTRARKHAYNIVKNNSAVGIYKRSSYTGDESFVGDVEKMYGFYYFKEWPSEKCWILNKDGTLGKRVE